MSSGAGSGLHCRHCGREVQETRHLRGGYRVDYYTLHTGDAEPVLVAQPDAAAPPVTVWRLLRAINIVTCVECYRLPEIRREREALFRPETAEGHSSTLSFGGET
jgi:hypothetical protein